MARPRRAWPLLLLALSASLVVACATVVDFDVTSPPAETFDSDESDAAVPDGADGAADGASSSSEGVDAGDAPTAPPPPPQVCSCPIEEGCCAPKSGPGVCTPQSAAATCSAGGGLFLRCAGGDLANGRMCCLAADRSGTTYTASCIDGAAQVCSDTGECAQGSCTPIACRAVTLKVCLDAGEALPACP